MSKSNLLPVIPSRQELYKRNLQRQLKKRLARHKHLKILQPNNSNTFNTTSLTSVQDNNKQQKTGLASKCVNYTQSEILAIVSSKLKQMKNSPQETKPELKIKPSSLLFCNESEFQSIIPPEYFVKNRTMLSDETNHISTYKNILKQTCKRRKLENKEGHKLDYTIVDTDSDFVVDYCQSEIIPSSRCDDISLSSTSTDLTVCNDKVLPLNDEDVFSSSESEELDLTHKPMQNVVITSVVNIPNIKHKTNLDMQNTLNDIDIESEQQDFENSSNNKKVKSVIATSSIPETYGDFELIELDLNHTLLIVAPNSKIFFHGLIRIQVLRGKIEILGYNLQSPKVVNVYSPRGSSLLYFETNKSTSEVKESEITTNITILKPVIDKINNVLPGSAVILCMTLNSSKISFMEKHIAQQIFPKNAPVRCIFKNTVDDLNVLQINSQWDSIANELTQTSRVFACGGKSVGKSCFLRYIINKALVRHKKILFIDLDPGQSEFTVPCCISASVINEPIFGPNYTHLQEPLRCIFVTEVNIGHHYTSYLRAVQDLITSCKDIMDIPVVINFMGFTRGIGFDLLSAVVAFVAPTTIVEIKSRFSSRNYSQKLQHDNIMKSAAKLIPTLEAIPPFSYVSFDSMADDVQGWHLEPRQIREMVVLCYFGDMLQNCDDMLTHPKVPIYELDLSMVKLLRGDKAIDPAAINANIVALCTQNDSGTYNCYGMGIVRAIDLDLNICYLITPVSLEQLQNVDHLIMGAVNLPPSVYMSGRCYSGLIPYVGIKMQNEYGAIPKRSHLSRKAVNN